MKRNLWPTLAVICITSWFVAAQAAAPAPFSLKIRTDASAVPAGSEITIQVQLRNNSKQIMDLSANINDLTGVDPNYQFDVRDDHGIPVPLRTYKHPELATGHAIIRSLSPGETVEDSEPISRLFDMRRPGKYSIEVSRRISGEAQGATLKSNRIFITVSP